MTCRSRWQCLWPRSTRLADQTSEQLSRAEVELYFGERPWGSRISAWASRQSQLIEGRSGLEEAFERHVARWPDQGGSADVPVPEVGDGALDDAGAWRLERRQP